MIDKQNRWLINKIGLINFWLYDHEEFNFYDGRLLLRGSNGSGKSNTMQIFIPFLLDGNRSPERIDPFGGRARKLDTYLLGEPGSSNYKDDSMAYLYMELYKADEDKYLTIGIGLHARAGRPLDFWGFSLVDNQRINVDFSLFEDSSKKVILSKQKLKKRLENTNNMFVSSSKEYMKMVNDLVFGFENLTLYDEFIKLQLQLRSPKLSDEFKPTTLADILTTVLQPLSDEDLRPMSESIESMNSFKEKLETLETSKNAIQRFLRHYNNYNKACLLIKANNLVTTKDELNKVNNDLNKQTKLLNDYHKNKTNLINSINDLKIELNTYQQKQQQLNELGVSDLLEKSLLIEQSIKEISSILNKKENDLKAKENTMIDIKNKKNEFEENLITNNNDIKECLNKLDELHLEISFNDYEFFELDYSKYSDKEYNFKIHENELKQYENKLKQIKIIIEKIDKLDYEYNQKLEEHEQINNLIRIEENKINEFNTELEENKVLISELLISNEKNNLLLKFNDFQRNNLLNLINELNSEKDIDFIKQEINLIKENINNDINDKLNKQTVLLQLKQKEINEKKLMIEKLENEPEIKMEKTNNVIATRKLLASLNIPFISLNESIDFKDNIDDEIKNNLEAALLDMGLLDALIIPNSYKKQVLNLTENNLQDKFLWSNFKTNNNLTKYLKITIPDHSKVNYNDVLAVLESISLDSGLVKIKENGEYQLALIHGKTSSDYISKYIGIETRRKYKENLLNNLNNELNELEKQIKDLDLTIDDFRKQTILLNEEFTNFISFDNVLVVFRELKLIDFNLTNLLKQLETKWEIVLSIDTKLKDLRLDLQNNAKYVEVKLNLDSINEVLEIINEYKDDLKTLEIKHKDKLNTDIHLKMITERYEDIVLDIDELKVDIDKQIIDLKLKENEKKNIEEILNQEEYLDVKKEIEECKIKLNELPDKINDFNSEHVGCTKDIEYKEKEIIEIEKLLKEKEFIFNAYERIFYDEYCLYYVVSDVIDKKNALDKARELITENKEFNYDQELSDLENKLNDHFNNNRNEFSAYSPTSIHILTYENEDRIFRSAKRLEIMTMHQGQKFKLLELYNYLLNTIIDTNDFIKEEDRKLFEEILINSVGHSIRNLIYNSEAWVKSINEMMEEMQTSMGLTFSLDWQPKKAINEEELDVKELVNFLKADMYSLKDSDLKKLSDHFRSKIKQAENKMLDKDNVLNFHAVMKEILDYRNWFEFRLRYKRGNDLKKELTNNTVGTFSGGEKALAIYLPLFAAVFAKYKSAKDDALRIISLDEIFARVDDNNIAMMFKLLTDLDIDYIGTSQVLWGDYSTIPMLSVCELRRPNNADVVMVVRYKWNGSYKQLLGR